MKLLLVEDEPILSKSIARGLKKRGYMVDCAYDGEEALELYAVNEYDLMILDLNLPKLDGMEVLRQLESGRAIRCLVRCDDRGCAFNLAATGTVWLGWRCPGVRALVRKFLSAGLA